MKKNRKLIGVIISQADAPYASRLITGITHQAYKLDYDVAVFSTFIKDMGNLGNTWHKGEENIFNVINYSMLDGIIIVPDWLQTDNVGKKLEMEIKEKFDKPVVSVDIDVPGFSSLFTDDVQSVKMLVSHLIEVHKLTDIAFMTGIEGHPHATNRLMGYYEALIEHNLPIDHTRIFYGDFWYEKGDEVVQALFDGGRPLPQAVACASDTMAISICEAFRVRGVRVPEDVVVTGYDSIEEGINYVPSITSADVPAQNTGIRAVNLLHSLITDTEFVDIPRPTYVNVAQSCGCSVNHAEKMRAKHSTWHDEDFYGSFSSIYNFMLETLISSKDYQEYFENLGWYCHYLGDNDYYYYICLCDNWDNLGENDQNPDYLKDGYTQKMYMPMLKHGETARVNLDRCFDISEMLPAIYEKRNKPTTFFFTPLHFNDRCFGYSVISYGDKATSYSTTFRKWSKYVCSSLESLRRQRTLQYMYEKMENNAVTDLLTGIYNRNGFNLHAENIFNQAQKNKQKFTLILGDMNNLKYINDCYGHIDGDFAIKCVANSFSKICNNDMPCFRIGGDEFVIVSRMITSENQIDKIKKSIIANLKEINATANKNYAISISLGSFFDDADKLDSIEQAVSAADAEMFSEKEKYKSENGFNYRKSHYAK